MQLDSKATRLRACHTALWFIQSATCLTLLPIYSFPPYVPVDGCSKTINLRIASHVSQSNSLGGETRSRRELVAAQQPSNNNRSPHTHEPAPFVKGDAEAEGGPGRV